MKFYAILLALTILTVANCGFDFVKSKKKDKCPTTTISCKCGKGKSNVMIPMQQCKIKTEPKGKKTCQPCNKPFIFEDVCKRFENCKTCMNGVPNCITCPEGRKGDTCSQIIDLAHFGPNERMWLNPYMLTLPTAASDDQKKRGRHARASDKDTCNLTEPKKTNEVNCVIYPSMLNCTQKCVYGHTFPEGIVRNIHCYHVDNTWSHDSFEECEPYASCTRVLLTEPGDVYCVSHQVDKRSHCEIKCFAHDDNPEYPRTAHTCHLDSTWEPSLPSCAKKDEELTLVQAPSTSHDAYINN